MNEDTISVLVRAVAEGKLKELEAERLLNAITRANTNVPTGTSTDENSHTRN